MAEPENNESNAIFAALIGLLLNHAMANDSAFDAEAKMRLTVLRDTLRKRRASAASLDLVETIWDIALGDPPRNK